MLLTYLLSLRVLPVRLSVTYGLVILKQEKRKKIKIGVDVPLGTSKRRLRTAECQFSLEKVKGKRYGT